jgi:hypothetical protein
MKQVVIIMHDKYASHLEVLFKAGLILFFTCFGVLLLIVISRCKCKGGKFKNDWLNLNFLQLAVKFRTREIKMLIDLNSIHGS